MFGESTNLKVGAGKAQWLEWQTIVAEGPIPYRGHVHPWPEPRMAAVTLAKTHLAAEQYTTNVMFQSFKYHWLNLLTPEYFTND